MDNTNEQPLLDDVKQKLVEEAMARFDKALAAKDARIEFLERACAQQNRNIEQTLGKALGYPYYKDDPKHFPDATEADGVFVGEHVAETLADEAARKLAEQAAEIERLKHQSNYWCAQCKEAWEHRDGANRQVSEFEGYNSELRQQLAALTAKLAAATRFKFGPVIMELLFEFSSRPYWAVARNGSYMREPGSDCFIREFKNFNEAYQAAIAAGLLGDVSQQPKKGE